VVIYNAVAALLIPAWQATLGTPHYHEALDGVMNGSMEFLAGYAIFSARFGTIKNLTTTSRKLTMTMIFGSAGPFTTISQPFMHCYVSSTADTSPVKIRA
jgi:hypothetical protein